MGTTPTAAASNLQGIEAQYASITHNLANVSTTGFKRLRTSFQEVLDQAGGGDGASAPAASTQVDFTQGPVAGTGRSLDLAITGKAFFVLETPTGPLYTRNGTFATDAQGNLVDTQGRLVAGEGGPIVVPASVGASRVSVAADGTVLAAGRAVGKVRLVEFANRSALVSEGSSGFRAPAGVEPQAAENSTVTQGCLESSNVNVAEELVGLIAAVRLYEMNLKSVTATDDRLKSLLQVAMA
jgi:flagellar basal-body rod protein FlgF